MMFNTFRARFFSLKYFRKDQWIPKGVAHQSQNTACLLRACRGSSSSGCFLQIINVSSFKDLVFDGSPQRANELQPCLSQLGCYKVEQATRAPMSFDRLPVDLKAELRRVRDDIIGLSKACGRVISGEVKRIGAVGGVSFSSEKDVNSFIKKGTVVIKKAGDVIKVLKLDQ